MKINSSFEKIELIPKISYKENEMTNFILHKWLKNSLKCVPNSQKQTELHQIFNTDPQSDHVFEKY